MSTTEVSVQSAIEENLMADARELVLDLGRKLTHTDIREYGEAGIDLQHAAELVTRDYEGDINFMQSVQKYYRKHGKITGPQAAAVLDIWRKDLQKQSNVEPAEVKEDNRPSCVMCGGTFDSFDELDEHKNFEHGTKATKQEAIADTGEAADVLEVTESKLGLDLFGLPDCKLALPNPKPDPSNPYIFLEIKRVRRTRVEDRRYRYGKVVTGNEVVVAGTIEVREFISDQREWVGAQKPGDVYRGQFEEQLQTALMMPEPFARLFGKLMKRCGRCGKRLTDEVSQAIGLGLDCEQTMDTYWKGPKYTYIGKDRPDPSKADPKDANFIPPSVYEQLELKGGS